MNGKILFRKTLVFIIITFFLCVGIIPSINANNYGNENKYDEQINDITSGPLNSAVNDNNSSLIFYTFDKSGRKQNKVDLPVDVAVVIKDLFEDLEYKIVYDPRGVETQELKNSFISLADEYGLISERQSRDDVFSLLNPVWLKSDDDNNNLRVRNPFSNALTRPFLSAYFGSSVFCSVSSAGSGLVMPLFMLPRPRAVGFWFSYDYSVTSVANLFTGRGFIAGGVQGGLLLGFMGIGLSYAIPGATLYGFIGYSLFAGVTAEFMEFYPPNNIPVISDESPVDGSVNVPVDLGELSFHISDADGDLMNYSVSTSPSIGSGNGVDVGDGLYSVDVSNLNSNTEYSWHVVVSDGEDFSEETFSFRTAVEAPFVSDPVPVDGDVWVSIDLSELSFRLDDLQGDLMDFSVETSPDIGSGSGVGVGNGVYSVSVDGLDYNTDYAWFVNVTDGEYETRRFFVFRTQPLMVFDPFEEGWQYRKQVVVNHSQVAVDLVDFPVLVSVVDPDLAAHAQFDGDDVLFMDGVGVANRLLHEIEFFDGSSGELVAWVNVTSLSADENTVFYLYYGNPICGSQQVVERVWDSNYIAVYHLNGINYLEIDDSTYNNLDVIEKQGNPIFQVPGKIGLCIDFDEASLNVDDSNLLSFTDGSNHDKPMTIEAWVKCDIPGSSHNPIISKYAYSQREWILIKPVYEPNKGMLYFIDENSDATIRRYTETSLNVDNTGWNYIAGVYNGNETGYGISFVLDGLVEKGDQITSSAYSGMKNLNEKMRIGSYHNVNENKWYYWQGLIDEVRISKIARTSEWLITSYNAMNDPSNFFSLGLEETP